MSSLAVKENWKQLFAEQTQVNWAIFHHILSKSKPRVHPLLLKWYIYFELRNEKSDNVSMTTFEIWIQYVEGKTVDAKVRTFFVEYVEKTCLRDSVIERLYCLGKKEFCNGNYNLAEKIFWGYDECVKCKVPFVRPPKENRYLFYLYEIEREKNKVRNQNLTLSIVGSKWFSWQHTYDTLHPKTMVQIESEKMRIIGFAAFNQARKWIEINENGTDSFFQNQLGLPKVLFLLIFQYTGVTDFQESRKKLFALQDTPSKKWTAEHVQNWLDKNDLSPYCAELKENHVDGNDLLLLTEPNLVMDYKVTHWKTRQKLLQAIGDANKRSQVQFVDVDREEIQNVLSDISRNQDVEYLLRYAQGCLEKVPQDQEVVACINLIHFYQYQQGLIVQQDLLNEKSKVLK